MPVYYMDLAELTRAVDAVIDNGLPEDAVRYALSSD